MGLDNLKRVICLKNFTPASRRAGKGRQVKTQSAQEHAMNAIKIVADFNQGEGFPFLNYLHKISQGTPSLSPSKRVSPQFCK